MPLRGSPRRIRSGADRFRAMTGLPISTYSSALKLAWILDEGGPESRAAAEAGDLLFGTINSWLIWHLTGGASGGVHVTDVTNASRTMLMGLESLAWEPALLDAVGVPAAMLPAIRSSSEVYGTGVGDLAGVPIAGDLGDQQAALFGQACFEAGQIKCTYGTGCFMLMHTGERPVHSAHGLITTVAARLGDAPATYALEGSVAVAGSLIQWLRDNLGIIGDAAEVEALARSVPDLGDVVFVPAFSGLFAPHWRSDARGVIAGLTRYATRGHIARAALESTAYQVHDLGDAMVADLGRGAARGAARGRRDDPQRAADAVPGGHPGPAGRGAPDRRDERPRRRLRGRPGRRVLVRSRRAASDGPGRPALGAVDGRGDACGGDRALAQGRGADARLGGRGRLAREPPSGRDRPVDATARRARSARQAGMYSGAATAQMIPPTIIAVEIDVPSASAASMIAPRAPAGWPTIEFRLSTVVRCGPSTSRWSSVMCIGFDAPWAT